MKDSYCELQESLANTYSGRDCLQYSLPPCESPQPGQSYAVCTPAAWYRGVAFTVNKDMDKILVRLVDSGRMIEVSASALYKLAPEFLSLNACSFLVHLSQLSRRNIQDIKEEVKYMQELLKDQDVVKLVRRAPPQLVDKNWSLPVEISWVEMEDVDPFMPAIKREVYLSQRLLSRNNNNNSASLDDTFELADDVDDTMAGLVKNIKMEEEVKPSNEDQTSGTTANLTSPVLITSTKPCFKWLNPELPVKRHFYARATFVDDAGQIYMHLNDQRKQFRTLRSNLNNHFHNSSPDCTVDSFKPYQEVVAMYVDNVWYRARFLGYVSDTEYEESYVLFVDWGNTCIVKTILIRSNIIEHDKPIFAFKAVLHNVLPHRPSWTPDAIDFMMEKVIYTSNNTIKVQVESGLDRQPLLVTIELYSPLDPGDSRKEVFKPWINMAELLVQKNEARYADQCDVDSADQRKSRQAYDYGIGFTVMKKRKNKKDKNIPMDTNICHQHQIPRPDINCMNLSPGSIIKCRLAAVDSWDKVFIHIVSEENVRGMVNLYSSFSTVERCMQAKCPDMPPVITPREGLTVALRREKSKGGWCRAEILECEESGYLVNVVDWGVNQYVSDSRVFRQIPDECLGVPVQAVPLHLPIVALEECDTLLALLTECLLSAEDIEMVVQVSSCEGCLFGHLLDKENNLPMYKRLEKEKLLKLV